MTKPVNYIAQCQAGHRHAFKLLYQDFAPYVFTICRRYGIAESDCADTLQEIFAEIFSSISRFHADKGSLKSWIRAIAVHKILSMKRRRVLDVVHLTEQHDWSHADNDALSRLQEADLLRLISHMPEGYQTVFNLYVVDGYSHEDIHKMLGIKVETSRSQLMRARKWLQRHLANYYSYALPATSEPQVKMI